jgi:hypothetical protein
LDTGSLAAGVGGGVELLGDGIVLERAQEDLPRPLALAEIGTPVRRRTGCDTLEILS